MTSIVRCPLRPDFLPLAGTTADWVQSFYPDVGVSIEGDVAIVSSERRPAGELALIWTSGLVNERLLERGRGDRAAVLARLVE